MMLTLDFQEEEDSKRINVNKDNNDDDDGGPDSPVVDSDVQNELMAMDPFSRLEAIDELMQQAAGEALPEGERNNDDAAEEDQMEAPLSDDDQEEDDASPPKEKKRKMKHCTKEKERGERETETCTERERKRERKTDANIGVRSTPGQRTPLDRENFRWRGVVFAGRVFFSYCCPQWPPRLAGSCGGSGGRI